MINLVTFTDVTSDIKSEIITRMFILYLLWSPIKT